MDAKFKRTNENGSLQSTQRHWSKRFPDTVVIISRVIRSPHKDAFSGATPVYCADLSVF